MKKLVTLLLLFCLSMTAFAQIPYVQYHPVRVPQTSRSGSGINSYSAPSYPSYSTPSYPSYPSHPDFEEAPAPKSQTAQAYYIKNGDVHGIKIKIGYTNAYAGYGNAQTSQQMVVSAYYNPGGVSEWRSCNAKISKISAMSGEKDLLEFFTYKAYINGVGTVYF